MPPMPASPGTGQCHGIETTRPDSIKAAAYANGGLVAAVQYDDYGNPITGQAPQPQRYMIVPAGRTGNAREILRDGALSPTWTTSRTT